MKKSFLEGLEKQRKNKVSSKTIVSLYKNQIIEAIKSGFSVLDVYNYMLSENIYPYSYSAFTRAIKSIESLDTNVEKNSTNERNEVLAAKKDEPLKFNPKADISKLIWGDYEKITYYSAG